MGRHLKPLKMQLLFPMMSSDVGMYSLLSEMVYDLSKDAEPVELIALSYR